MFAKRSKIKCAHCQKVHHYKFECDEINALKTFAGHDKWVQQFNKREERRKKLVIVGAKV